MYTNGKTKFAGIVMAALIAAAPVARDAMAASDGSMGSTSTGTVNISLTIPNLVKISGLTDIAFGAWGGGDMTATISFCVFSSTRRYTVTASSQKGVASGDNTFQLEQGGNKIDYEVRFTDTDGDNEDVKHGSASTTLDTNAKSVNCTASGDKKTSMRIHVPAASIGSAPASATPYSDVLTIVVSPQ